MSQEPLDHPDRPYKVVVWATGRVGRLAIRAVADRPNLELVGVWVHSESKDGKDAGTIARIDPLGVAATRDDEAILAGDADCVIYTGPATSRPSRGDHRLLPHSGGGQEHRHHIRFRAWSTHEVLSSSRPCSASSTRR